MFWLLKTIVIRLGFMLAQGKIAIPASVTRMGPDIAVVAGGAGVGLLFGALFLLVRKVTSEG